MFDIMKLILMKNHRKEITITFIIKIKLIKHIFKISPLKLKLQREPSTRLDKCYITFLTDGTFNCGYKQSLPLTTFSIPIFAIENRIHNSDYVGV